MRATGVEPVRESAQKKSQGSKGGVWGLGLSLLVVVAGTAFWLSGRSSDIEGPVPVRPLNAAELASVLKREQVQAAGLDGLFAASDAIEAFAKQSSGASSDAFGRAEAMTRTLRDRQKAQAFVPWSLGEPRPTPIMKPDALLKLLSKDGGRAELYPLELCALEIAALRSVGVNAMLAELPDSPSDRAPLDPAGYFGYFVVQVAADDEPSAKTKLYDPYGGRALHDTTKVNVLDDAAALGAALATRAVHEISYLADPKLALDSSSFALRLAARLPSVRTARGIVVLSGKMVEQGLQELSAAAQLRRDAVRLHNLASARMLSGDVEAATKDLNAALEKAPDFAGARATLGALQMLQGDLETGRASLQRAESLAPDLSLIQWGFAELAMREGDRDGGLARGKQALNTRGSFDGRLRYAVLLRQASKYEEMRVQAHALIDAAPAYRKQEVRELIGAVLGPTALDPLEPDPSADDLSDLGGPDLSLKLGQGSKLLGADPQGTDLKLGEPGAGSDPLILLGEPSKLRLQGSSDKLELKLGK